MIYLSVYCWKYVYDLLWCTIKVGSYIDSNILVFAHGPQSCESISLDASIA